MTGRTLALTALAMIAFAANSLLCRYGLQSGSIDAASFGSVRLLAGALTLVAIVRWRARSVGSGAAAAARTAPDWVAAAMLWLYVAGFSFAYLSLSAGTGALILFGAVQLTMFSAGLRAGERFGAKAWLGFGAALAGLVYLVWPGVTAPAPQGAALMAGAGIAWGVYSLRGRRAADALAATAGNFARAVPMALAASVVFAASFRVGAVGVVAAIVSGALTSGVGYVLWYAALPKLGALRAATVQLAVPPLAAAGGALLLAEPWTLRLVLASIAILGGVALVLFGRGVGVVRR